MTADITTAFEGRLVLTEIFGIMTRTDLDQSFDVIYEACEHALPPICCIFEIAKTAIVSGSLVGIAISHPKFPFKHSNFGLCITTTPNLFVRKLIEVVVRIDARSRDRLISVNTVDAAMQMAKQFLLITPSP